MSIPKIKALMCAASGVDDPIPLSVDSDQTEESTELIEGFTISRLYLRSGES
jgi:hypothetical protein